MMVAIMIILLSTWMGSIPLRYEFEVVWYEVGNWIDPRHLATSLEKHAIEWFWWGVSKELFISLLSIVAAWAVNIMSNSTLKLVDHTYRDFSTYLDDGGRLFKHKKCHKNFPAQLHKILSDPDNSEIVTWMVRSFACYYWIPFLFIQHTSIPIFISIRTPSATRPCIQGSQ